MSLPDNPFEGMEPAEVSQEMGRAWVRLSAALAARGGCVLIVEDLHWASDELLELIERMARNGEGPLLLLATTRPELLDARPELTAGISGGVLLPLEFLTVDQATRLVEGLLPAVHIPQGVRQEILAKAEGNPFFVEEILRSLIDQQVLVRQGGTWRYEEAPGGLVLPDSVRGVLAARIDALPPAEKRILREAAVVGRRFWEAPLERLVRDAAVRPRLKDLERRGLVLLRPDSSLVGQVEWAFRHALVQEVALQSLPMARRARAHAEVGIWFEELAGERREEFADWLVHHYLGAVNGEGADLAWAEEPTAREDVEARAFAVLLLGGTVARQRSGLSRAVELHEHALRLAGTDADRARILEELGEDHESAFHGEEAFDGYGRAIDLLRRDPAGREAVARVCAKAARIATRIGAFRRHPDPEQVDALVSEGLQADPEDRTRAELLALRGRCVRLWDESGDPIGREERIRSAEQAMSIAERLDDPELVVLAADALGFLYSKGREPARALRVARRQLDFLDRVRSRWLQAEILSAVADATIDVEGRYEEVLELARRSYELSREMSPHQVMHATFFLIEAAYRLGRWEEALSYLDEHLEAYEQERGVTCGAVRSGPVVGAVVLAHRGETDRARRIVQDVWDA
jgi:tetratricopeptide (TPR) repeat protein